MTLKTGVKFYENSDLHHQNKLHKKKSFYFERQLTDKLGDIALIIECDSSAIMNALLPSLSLNNGSVY